MARTLRTGYDFTKRSSRDGSVRTWTTRGRRVRGEVAARRAERQAARAEVRAQLAEIVELQEAKAAEIAAHAEWESMAAWEKEEKEFWAEMAQLRQRLVDQFGEYSEEVYMHDNPAYAKWVERQWEAA